MNKQNLARGLRLLFSASMIAVLIISMAPIQTSRAEGATFTSDLVITLVSIPKHVKACDIFQVVYTVTNLGPDPAYGLSYPIGIPDAFGVVGYMGAPDFLFPGQTVTFSVVIQVVAFTSGEERRAWVGGQVASWPPSYISIDPNSENNSVYSPIKIIGRPISTFCF